MHVNQRYHDKMLDAELMNQFSKIASSGLVRKGSAFDYRKVVEREARDL